MYWRRLGHSAQIMSQPGRGPFVQAATRNSPANKRSSFSKGVRTSHISSRKRHSSSLKYSIVPGFTFFANSSPFAQPYQVTPSPSRGDAICHHWYRRHHNAYTTPRPPTKRNTTYVSSDAYTASVLFSSPSLLLSRSRAAGYLAIFPAFAESGHSRTRAHSGQVVMSCPLLCPLRCNNAPFAQTEPSCLTYTGTPAARQWSTMLLIHFGLHSRAFGPDSPPTMTQ